MNWNAWLRQELVTLAAKKYPNDPQKQMLYQLGFLQAQLVSAFMTDSHILSKFKQAVKQAE